MAKKLMLYRNAKELHKYQNSVEKEIYPFVFAETKTLLEYNADVVIDITSLVRHVLVNSNDILPAEVNLNEMGEDTTIIAHQSVSNAALELFPYILDESDYLFPEENEIGKKQNTKITRNTIYTYNNNETLLKIVDYCDVNEIAIISFPRASEMLKEEIDSTNANMRVCIDLTSLAFAIEDNKNILYLSEQFLGMYKTVDYIVKTKKADKILEFFPLYFDNQKSIKELYEKVNESEFEEKDDNKISTIINADLNYVDSYVQKNLVGHNNFKKELFRGLRNFVKLFNAGEKPIFSIFLFGKSGIGKTEVARLLKCAIDDKGPIAKINFQNYSSQDALNSLIGSPAGYIGCEHGELGDKISKSKVGVLLCDEFEKTNRPVFSYFLQLLEEGKFTDSLAREYDMSGYIIIFTSNIENEAEYKKTIPPELQTRFDIVCEFEPITLADKVSFINLLKEQAAEKYDEFDELNSMEIRELENVKNYPIDSLREIKNAFLNKLMDLFEQHEKYNSTQD